MASERIRTDTSEFWIDDDGILRAVSLAGVETLETAKANVAAASRLAAGRLIPVFIDLRNMKTISREARVHYAGEEAASHSLAQALLIESRISKVIGNFFIGLNKPPFPTRLFTSEAEAIEWLKRFMK